MRTVGYIGQEVEHSAVMPDIEPPEVLGVCHISLDPFNTVRFTPQALHGDFQPPAGDVEHG
jgi:hypothetical protein